MKKSLLHPWGLLPFAILLGVLVVTLRIADVWDLAASGKLESHTAQAEDAATPAPVPTPSPSHEIPAREAQGETKKEILPPSDSEASPAEMDVLKQLSERREQLEKRSRDLDTRESLMKITEQRVTQKIKEMEVLRGQVQSLVDQAGGAEQAQLDNLVKIYETMKPDEAAKIFETLDMPILLGVIQRMKPARTAPIMAKLPPEKAKEVTIALTKQDQLPQVK
jgi:flagellar motility protein MotE (MotC chaperone)